VRVCVDAGHGYPDPGAVGLSGLGEADVTLLCAQAIADQLKALGHQVVLTREDRNALDRDKATDLTARARKANNARCDAFVSIHCNSVADRAANGSETWHYPRSTLGKRLAERLQAALVNTGLLRDRGIRQSAGLAVLRLTGMPAALVELGFLSNPEEEKRLSDAEWLSRVAKALADAVDKWGQSQSSETPQSPPA
jgi:N-acetylmuramoyl-L-alanine amidase